MSAGRDASASAKAVKNGPILFDYERYLATVDSDGSHLTVYKHHLRRNYFDGQGKFSEDGKRITLLCGGRQVCIEHADGTHRRILTKHANGEGPTFSPDGRRIAFQASWYDGTGPEGIWEMRTDGSRLRNLVASGGADWPTFSPNGKYIAYMQATGISPYDIYLMNANGSNQHPLTSSGEYHQPDYSPSGKSIVFFHYPTYSIQVIHPDGTGQHLIKLDGTDPVYSPNGRRIAFTRHCNIWVMHADGSHAHEVFDKKMCANVDDWGPR